MTDIGEHGNLVTFAAETRLRPREWLALERRDVDKVARRVCVEREHVEGVTKPYGKTTTSRHAVPLTQRARDALEALPPSHPLTAPVPLDTGGYVNTQLATSVEMIECTYGHLVEGADDAFRSRLDAFAASRGEKEPVSR